MCAGEASGSATISGVGGEAPYSFEWNFGDTTTTVDNLLAGSYTVTLTDNKGCTADTTIMIAEPDPIDLMVDTLIEVMCFGESTGFVSVLIQGGTPPYAVEGDLAPTTLASGMATFENLTVGEYTITITDANNCSDNISF